MVVAVPVTSSPDRAILVELNHVIFKSSFVDVGIPENTYKSILCCGASTEYQCGKAGLDQYYSRLSKDFDTPKSQIHDMFSAINKTVQVDHGILACLARLKAHCRGTLAIYGACNMSCKDFEKVQGYSIDWNIFDGIFISGDMGISKPELRFFSHILDRLQLAPSEVIVVDHNTDNVLTAISMGMSAVLANSPDDVQRSLVNYIERNPTERGRKFLERNAKNMHSVTHTGVLIRENFAQLMILEATGDSTLVDIKPHATTWNYFIDKPVLTQKNFPDDLDTTSLGLTITNATPEVANQVLNKILHYRTYDGLIMYGRGEEVSDTFDWVQLVLRRRAYIHGTAFYPSPEAFLFFFSRLLRRLESPPTPTYNELEQLLRERVAERIGVPVDAISLAMRLLVCHQVGMRDTLGLEMLLSMQQPDGGWPLGTIYHYASKKQAIGNRGVSTALAVQAIDVCSQWKKSPNGHPKATVYTRTERHYGSP
ncbi:hypothetical protein CBS147320_10720 [Aspergillus niger]|nr:hypothetical protein CBS12448_10485 [Aspergillus niger]KAI2912915.1 hypothetical protein CBS147320_10720 [Aspergillus niger]KAI3038130.1 hypothetical protein CBS147352_10790 [Aspergillus niger]